MKKIYVSPITEVVILKLTGSVLGGDGTPVIASPVADPDDSFAKEQGSFFDDIWEDEEEPNPYDLWGE